MIAELGHFSLILALGFSLLLAIVPSIGVFSRRSVLTQAAPSFALALTFFVWLAFLALTEAFISHDFSVLYVAHHSNSHLPLPFRISAVWGGHEGSLLLWIALLCAWIAAVVLKSTHWEPTHRACTLSVLGAIATGFLLFILTTSNPFERILPIFPNEGRDLNPLLQDFALIIHPPMLYMGYVGFAVAFALAIAALWQGKLTAEWAKRALPWTLCAWVFLTLGITLGSWWAYYELGWGGWWFWDPVENASLMPWLIGTALIHSLLVTAKRDLFKSWTVLLAILAFSLSLLGTFLVRSGVLTSVHAFANDPERGFFILCFMILTVGSALGLYAVRANKLRSTGFFNRWSREALLLGNNLLLVVACATILLATLYPLVLDLLNVGIISIGAPYFNTLFVPLFIFLMGIMGAAPSSHWQTGKFVWNLRFPIYLIIVSILAGVLLKWLIPENTTFLVVLGIMVSTWLICTTFTDLFVRLYKKPLRQWLHISPSYYGMVVAHIGVAITACGVTLSSAYSIERDVRLTIGEQITVGGYEFSFTAVNSLNGPNFSGVEGEFQVFDNNQLVATLYPQRRVNHAQKMLTTKTAIDPGFLRDLYIALGEPLNENSWAVRIYYKPFVRWIWGGGLLMALGGLLAISDRWQRRLTRFAYKEKT